MKRTLILSITLATALLSACGDNKTTTETTTSAGTTATPAASDSAKMDGMATPVTIDGLATLSGTEFDTAYLTTMIRHHEGAIKMAERAIAEGTDPELKTIATKILGMRQGELKTFKRNAGVERLPFYPVN